MPWERVQFPKIIISRQTMTCRICGLATTVENTLKSEASNFGYYSLALDESTDVSNTALLAICIRGVFKVQISATLPN
jgi:hypothetical protein